MRPDFPISFKSGQLTFLLCVLLAFGLWMIQQFSKVYERWDSYPVKYERSFLSHSYVFDLNDIRIRSDIHGWDIAFDPSNNDDVFQINWGELVALNGNRSMLTDMICSFYNIDPTSIDQIEGLEGVLELRDARIKLLPVKADFSDVLLPDGYIITKNSKVSPDTVAIIGSSEELAQFQYWPVFISEITESLSEDTEELSVDISSMASQIMVSPKEIKVLPNLEQITEKRWDIPVLITPKLRDSFSVIPSFVQLIAQIPTGGFDNDSLNMIKAVMNEPDSIIAEGIQAISISPWPSCVQQFRLSPSFVTLLKKE